jgi:hypothetical protein
MNIPDPAQQALNSTLSRPRPPSKAELDEERAKCAADAVYFINTYCMIYDSVTASWVPFKLWPAQIDALKLVMDNKYSIVLKARQEGLSWLLGDVYALWQMLFKPIAEVLIFSQRDDEAVKLLKRLKGTYERLPEWMQPGILVDNDHEFRLTNGSGAQALPATAGGRSNAATYVVIDESDFVEGLDSLITAAKPTIDAGQNKMVCLSTANKNTPNSYYQLLYKAARDGNNLWHSIFLSWRAHPGRTQAWYDAVCRDAMNTKGTLDDVYGEYPETDVQALSARELNKRFPPQWISKVSHERRPLELWGDVPPLPGLKIYKYREPGHTYGIGTDPAGGFTDGDWSVSTVVDADTKELCAVLAGKIEPTEFANHTADLAAYYYSAPVLFEMNNHGQAVMSQLKERHVTLRYGLNRSGLRGNTPGWLTLERNKHMLYDVGAKVVQQCIEEARLTEQPVVPILFDFTTTAELASIDINELAAPEGQHDDHAMAWVLAQMCVYRGTPSMFQVAHQGLWDKPSQPNTQPSGVDKLAKLMQAQQIAPTLDVASEPQNTFPFDARTHDEWIYRLRSKGMKR